MLNSKIANVTGLLLIAASILMGAGITSPDYTADGQYVDVSHPDVGRAMIAIPDTVWEIYWEDLGDWLELPNGPDFNDFVAKVQFYQPWNNNQMLGIVIYQGGLSAYHHRMSNPALSAIDPVVEPFTWFIAEPYKEVVWRLDVFETNKMYYSGTAGYAYNDDRKPHALVRMLTLPPQNPPAVPEPGTYAMLASSVALAGIGRAVQKWRNRVDN